MKSLGGPQLWAGKIGPISFRNFSTSKEQRKLQQFLLNEQQQKVTTDWSQKCFRNGGIVNTSKRSQGLICSRRRKQAAQTGGCKIPAKSWFGARCNLLVNCSLPRRYYGGVVCFSASWKFKTLIQSRWWSSKCNCSFVWTDHSYPSHRWGGLQPRVVLWI